MLCGEKPPSPSKNFLDVGLYSPCARRMKSGKASTFILFLSQTALGPITFSGT